MTAEFQPNETRIYEFPIERIIVRRDDRQRTVLDPGALKALSESIEKVGLLNPITLRLDEQDKAELVAGERRLEAVKLLGLKTIRATFRDGLSTELAYLVELMENLARADLTWQDETSSIYSYHHMRQKQHGVQWTKKATATDLGMSESKISARFQVATKLAAGDEEVKGCPTFQGALNLIAGRAQRANAAASNRGIAIAGTILPATPAVSIAPNATPKERGAALMAHLLAGGLSVQPTAPSPQQKLEKQLELIESGELASAALEEHKTEQHVEVQCADFLEWLPLYSGPQFDVLHVDFPYGKNYSGANTRKQGRAHIAPRYADDPDIYWALLAALLADQDRIAYPIAHMLFWFDMAFYAGTVETIEAAGWKLVQPFPLLWTKGYTGIAADPQRRPRHCYETALLFSRGDRRIVKLDKDHFDCQLDEKLHINQKPAAMLEHFLRMIVDEHSAVFDPTCGSGSAIAAARKLGCSRALGLELDPSNAEVAKFLIARGDA